MKTMSSLRLRRACAIATGLMTSAAMLTTAVPAHGAVIAPQTFPQGVALSTTAYTLQFAGDNREGTAAAIALDAAQSKIKTGGYPYQGTTPAADPRATPIYGPATCPKTIVLVADDTPADALAAAGLFGQSALSLVDTSGKAASFDTRGATLLLTQSGREGASQLDVTTTAAVAKIKATCGSGINGIVLGGTNAIPASVLDQFKAPLADVARVAGTDRDDTARAIAVAVAGQGGSKLPTVEYFPTPTTFGSTSGASALAKTIFLAEDQTGADALSVGAVAARLGVPLLLTTTDTLPQATANGIAATNPKSIVVLGGSSAVSDSVVSSAKAVAGSGTSAIRIFGANRYATSVAIAEQLLNLYPDYVGPVGANAYSDQLFGFARDEGTAASGTHVGWPDALASAYYLASLAGSSAPSRNVANVDKSRVNDGSAESVGNYLPVACGSSGSKCSPFTPLLLTTGSSLSPEVDSYLKAMYPSTGKYKTGSDLSAPNDGGFGFVFGGSAAVSGTALFGIAGDVAGGTYSTSSATDTSPAIVPSRAFYTTLDLSKFTGGMLNSGTALFSGAAASAAPGTTPVPKVCVMPAGLGGAAGVESLNDAGGYAAANSVDYYSSTVAYPAGTPLGSCVDLTSATPASTKSTSTFYAVSLSGNVTPPVFFGFTAAQTLAASSLGSGPSGNTDTGSIFNPISSGTSEAETLTYKGMSMQSTTYKGTSVSGATADLVVKLVRTKAANSKDVISWTGTFTVFNGTTQVFAASIPLGYTDTTPATSGAISSQINLMGEYSAPGLGGMVLTISPAVVPGSVPAASNLFISGNA